MEKLVIHGGRRLEGRVKISGAKNAVLPIIAATLLGQDSPSLLDEVPALEDVHTITEVLQKLGVKAEFRKGRISCLSTARSSAAARRRTISCARCAPPS